MLHLHEASQGLLLAYPAWVGALIVALGAAFFAYAARPRAWIRKRALLIVISTAMVAIGIDFLTYEVSLTDEAGELHGLMRPDRSIHWSDAAAATLEQRKFTGGEAWKLVVTEASGGQFDLPLGGLPEEERERVIAFVTTRVGP